MEAGLDIARHLVTALLNLAVAVLAGASITRWCLARDVSGWAELRRRPVRTAGIAAAVAALAASFVWLWLESAAMAEVPVTEAAAAAWSMLSATRLGFAWGIGTAALAVAGAGACLGNGRSVRPPLLAGAALALFWYARSMVSHAASDGDFSARLLIHAVHLALTSLWIGEVILAGCLMLRTSGNMRPQDRRARAAYVAFLSSSATLALAGIFVTGLYAAWRSLGSFTNLFGSSYGNTLLIKLLLVALAAMLGGLNRFFVMPAWRARECAGEAAPARLPARFRRILWIEALVLLAVLVLAAWLASTPPPG